MVTVSCPPMNMTWALVAGPRATPPDPKPCWGLHDTKYALARVQVATSVPPWEVSTVPPAVSGAGGGAERRAVGECRGAGWRPIRDRAAMRAADGRMPRRGATAGRAPARSAASLASARLTVATLCCSPALGVMSWPSTLTASTLPPVAALTPTSQAATPRSMRRCTSQGSCRRC